MIKSKRPIVLLGDGGHALSLADLLKSRGNTEIYVNSHKGDQKSSNLRHISLDDIKNNIDNLDLVLAIGDQKIRNEFMSRNKILFEIGVFPTLIHSTAYVSSESLLGRGSVILSNAYVGPSVSIGDFSIVNTHAVIEHGCRLGNSVIVSPNATLCGGVKIGMNTFLGVGACVAPGLELGENVTVGACSFVAESVNSNKLVYGTPARVIR